MASTRPLQLMTEPEPPLALVDLASLRRGAPETVEEVYRAHAQRLRTVALRLTASMPDAEDIVHDVFLRLPRAVDTYQEQGRFGEWLTTLVIRASLMHGRREQVRRHTSIEDIELVDPTVDGDPVAGARIMDALKALSPSLRHVFVLRAVHDYSHHEIAVLLGITTNTSEVRMHRAVQRLRTLLGALR